MLWEGGYIGKRYLTSSGKSGTLADLIEGKYQKEREK